MDDILPKHAEPRAKKEAIKTTLMELVKVREEIKKAREDAVQTWLDAMSVIEELEDHRQSFARSKKKITMSTTAIASLKTLLKSTTMISSSKGKAMIAIQEMRQVKNRKRKENKRLELEIDLDLKARAKLEQEFRIKRLSLRRLQFTQRAVHMEIEACNASVDAAMDQIKRLKVDCSMKYSHSLEEYYDREIATAEKHVLDSEQVRHAAEVRRMDALKRLEAIHAEMNLQGAEECDTTTNGVNEKFGCSDPEENLNHARMDKLASSVVKRESSQSQQRNMQLKSRRNKSMTQKEIILSCVLSCFGCSDSSN